MAERGPAKVRAHGQVSSPAGLGQTEASACQFLAVTSAPPLRVPGVPAELQEGRRVPAKCSAGAASLKLPSCPGRCAHLNPFYRWEDEAKARLPPSCHGLQNFPPPVQRKSTRLSGAGRAPAGRCQAFALPARRRPCAGGVRALLPPGSADPRPRGYQLTSRAVRMTGLDTYSAPPRGSSPQPAKWPAGTHLKVGETEAQRGQLLVQGHTASGTKTGWRRWAGIPRASWPAVPARAPRDTHSRSCPRAPAPPRTRSGQRPWCPRRGPPCARLPQALGWSRLRSGWSGLGFKASRDAGTALSGGFRVGPERSLL